MTKRLNDSRIRAAETDGSRLTLSDHQVGGLTVRVYPSGSKAFYYRYRWHDSTVDYKIGDYPGKSLAEARDEARSLKDQVRDGHNPMAQRKARKRKADVFTVEDLAEDFKKYHLPQLKESTQVSYRSRIKHIVDKFGEYSLDELHGRDIKRWLREVAEDQPTNANRIQAIFSKMYSFAVEPDQDYTTNHPLKGMNKVAKESTREPDYDNDDIRDLWEAFGQESQPTANLLKLLMITGQRLGETSRMKWVDIDADSGLWTIPKADTKGDRTHIVPLPPLAVDTLEEVHPLTGSRDYVFASPVKDNGPLSHFKAVTDRVREATGLRGFRIHDLRHIAITGMISIGVDMVHVGKTVAHKGLGKEHAITDRYVHFTYLEEKREALGRWSAHLQQVIDGEQEAKVLPFKTG